MARVFRQLALAFALLTLLPAAGRAAPLALEGGWLNSSLTFGGPTFEDRGYDINGLLLYGIDIAPCDCIEDVFFTAGGGSLVSKTSAAGQTVWRYEGGTFSLRFENSVDPFFTAPIASVEISVSEPVEPDAFLIVWYELGPGLFDAAFAALHGVPVQTGSGLMDESMILWEGDAQSTELLADEGGGNLSVNAPDVPEPALSVLVGLGLAAVVRARSRKS